MLRYITAKEISQGARKFRKALPKMLTIQNGQYFIDKLQQRLTQDKRLDDRHARMTSDRPITFEDFCAVMKDLVRVVIPILIFDLYKIYC